MSSKQVFANIEIVALVKEFLFSQANKMVIMMSANATMLLPCADDPNISIMFEL